jgi:hypothetical protein
MLIPGIRLTVGSGGSVNADGVLFVQLGTPMTLDDSATAEPAGTTATSGPDGLVTDQLTDQGLQPIVAEAKQLWRATGLSPAEQAALDRAQVSVASLHGSLLGLTSGNVIWIDGSAAERGWYVTAIPADTNALQPAGGQFQALPGSPAFGHVDLLTVVSHELGHLLGLEDMPAGNAAGNLMADALPDGIERLPGGHSGADIPIRLSQAPAPIVSQQPMPGDIDSLLNRLPVRLLLSLREPAPVVDAVFGGANVVTSLPAASVAALMKSTEIGGHVSVLGSGITAEPAAIAAYSVPRGAATDELDEVLDLLVWNQAAPPRRRTK